MGISDCSDDFQYIFSWKDSNPTHFANYLNWKKTVGHNANKERMRITHASALPRIINEKERQHATDKTAIDTIIRHFSEIDLFEYLREEDALLLSKLIGKLKNSIYQHRISDLVDEKAISLVNFSINMIKSIADKSTNSVSKPSMAGLLGLAENRLVLLKAINHILNNLSRRETNYREKIGTLDEKGSIYINTRFRMLCQESKTDEFKKGIRKLLSAKEMLEKIAEHIFDSNISEIIQEFCNLCEEQGINSVLPFIGCSKQITNERGELYSPSNGEKGMLLLQRTILEEADAYFLDEPELGMGNSYIDTSIRPLLIDLSRRHKYVVVATHNANIGVRTLPYMSIYRTHSNGNYTTYSGNPFSDRLVNIYDPNDILNWAEESLKSLEGSKDAFYERKDIYESNNA